MIPARLTVALARRGVALGGLLLGSPDDVARHRRRAELLARLLPLPRDMRARPVVIGGVPAEHLTCDPADGALLYLHGGGYCSGSPRTHRALAARLAIASGTEAYVPAYRLAPEHPHPAALEDALASYRALLVSGWAPEQIVVAGDSAGGGLALALAQALRDSGEPLPTALGLLCPWLDLVPDHAGVRPGPDDPLLRRTALTTWAHAYSNGHGPEDPGVSPLRGDLSLLPPIIMHSAGNDPLRDDARRLAEALPAVEHRELRALWHVPHLLASSMAPARDAVEDFGAALRRRLVDRGPRVAVVGAGMSGLCIGELLLRADFDDFTIFEKADEVGGTWRENRYPGLTCDVPSRFYSYSFAPNPRWSSVFSPGPEIQRYFIETSRRRGLREHIRFGAEVVEARWENRRWRLGLRDGSSFDADVLVTATGVLHHPKTPDIPGRASFAGASFHSARWDESVAVEGARVAVIGNGSTGVQLTGALAGVAERLMLFQRTAQWIVPISNRPYSRLTRRLMEMSPALSRFAYRLNQRWLEAILGPAVTRPGWQRTMIGAICRANLRLAVRDPQLRERLRPDHQPMCKRLVMSSSFYSALQRDDVELVTEGIERIEPRGIVTADGTLHELDVIVFATGFDAHAYMRPMTIIGEDGLTLANAWRDGPRAYRTVAIPGFPNLFTLMGPHSPVGNHSLIAVAEAQAAYVVTWLRRMRRSRLAAVAPTGSATDAYYDRLRAALPDTVWTTGCDSWYLGADGSPEVWPWTPARHREMLAEPELRHFKLT